MIENLFLHFKTKDAFTAQLENISEDSIVFIKDSKEVYTHGQYYSCSVDLSVVDDEIKSFIVQELGQSTDKVPSQKLVEDTINTVIGMVSGLTTVVEGEKEKLEALTTKVTEIEDVTIPGINNTINSNKETVDNYTVNGYKISKNPVLNKTDIGLDKVDNTADVDKPISTATQEALDELESSINDHIANKSNPHQVTKEQVGLGNVTNDAQVKRSEMGVANGVATLNEEGKVPVSQLDGALAHVFGIEKAVANQSALPEDATEGEKYYVIDEKKIFERLSSEWDEGTTPKADTIYNFRKSDATGSEERTNILYRWDGADLVEISSSLALGETSGTAYEGNKGKATTDKLNEHVANTENPHNVTKAQVGLDKVDNTSDLEKPISTATQEALDSINEQITLINGTSDTEGSFRSEDKKLSEELKKYINDILAWYEGD